MLPRKSTVVKYISAVLAVGALLLLWTTPDTYISTPLGKYLVNETRIRLEFDNLKSSLNISDSQENKTLAELYYYVQRMKKQLPVNPHNFARLISPRHMCKDRDVFLLVYVHTSPNHHKHRMIIRETWGNPKNFNNVIVTPIFLMGKPAEQSAQDAIYYESDEYGDILQEDFVDSYRNLTYKAIMALKWISAHCKHAHFVLKTDDDIFVNMFNLVGHLKSLETQGFAPKDLLLCLVWYRMKVMRDPKSKWYLSPDEFQDDYFPPYCSGSAYIFSTDVIVNMYNASLRTPFFWVDDFYITGLLANAVGVQHKKFNSVYTLGPSTFLEKFSEEPRWHTLVFGHVHNFNEILHVWKKVLEDHGRSTWLI